MVGCSIGWLRTRQNNPSSRPYKPQKIPRIAYLLACRHTQIGNPSPSHPRPRTPASSEAMPIRSKCLRPIRVLVFGTLPKKMGTIRASSYCLFKLLFFENEVEKGSRNGSPLGRILSPCRRCTVTTRYHKTSYGGHARTGVVITKAERSTRAIVKDGARTRTAANMLTR